MGYHSFSRAENNTLVNLLATWATIEVVSGEALVNGCRRDASFQQKIGYVQQQDVHRLETPTLREVSQFSASFPPLSEHLPTTPQIPTQHHVPSSVGLS